MHIGILQTGHAPEALRREQGDYDAMFARLLDGHGFTFRAWDVEGMDFPNSVAAADGWLITGSRHSALEDHPWILPLEQFIRGAMRDRVPVVGVCFGHQIVAQALGGRVARAEGGWAVGRTEYTWPGHGSVALNAWHRDQVVDLPEGAEVIASQRCCPIAAVRYGDAIWTVQAHPEFDRDMVAGLMLHRGALVPEAEKRQAASRLDLPVDSAVVAAEIAAFFRAERGGAAG